MAQVKLIKINADGFSEEHGASDDATFATVTGTTQVAVTSGVTIDSNITFNAVTDTIAGIQNQNLLDKTASESISGVFDYTSLPTSSVAPTSGTQLTNKDYVDGLVNGLHWQEPVLDIQTDATLDPGASPTTGDRYIITDSGALNANFGTITGVGDDDIVEYDGANFVVAWDASTEGEGGAAWVSDEDKVYTYNGTAWVSIGSTSTHNALSGLQGGNGSTEYYHMTASEDTWLAAATGKVAAGGDIVGNNVNDTITATWTVTGEIDVAGGDLVLPNSTQAVPEEGSVYWDGTNDVLNVYDGTQYVTFDPNGETTTYTAGTGGIAQYDAVYISANDTVLKSDASATATSRIIGFAPAAITAATEGAIQEDGVLKGVLSAATAGDVYYLSTTPGTISTTVPTGTGQYVTRVGYAKNATDLQIQIQQVGRRA
jgi:hypothetical protein